MKAAALVALLALVATVPDAAADAVCPVEGTCAEVVDRESSAGSCASPGSTWRTEERGVRVRSLVPDPFVFVEAQAGSGCISGADGEGNFFRLHGVGGGAEAFLPGFGHHYAHVTWFAFAYAFPAGNHHECHTVVSTSAGSHDLGCPVGDPPMSGELLP